MRISDWSSDVCSSDLGKGAVAALHILNVGGAFGRIELAVTLHEGADFTLGAAQIGGGTQNLEIITTVTHAEPGATSRQIRSEEHTSELQSLMRISYAVFCLKKKKNTQKQHKRPSTKVSQTPEIYNTG